MVQSSFPARFTLHAAAVSVMSYGYFSITNLPTDTLIRNQYGGRSQFLTIQGFASTLTSFAAEIILNMKAYRLGITWITMIVSLIIDLFPSVAAFRKIKRTLLIVALPISVVISSIYWTLLSLFPALILQSIPHPNLANSVPYRLPLSVDLALHASPVLTLVIDFVLFETKYGKDTLSIAPLVISTFAIWYGSWVEHCAKNNNGTFPYPFLDKNSLNHRLIIYTGAALLGYFAFLTINRLHGWIRRMLEYL